MKKLYQSAVFRFTAIVLLLLSSLLTVFCLTGWVMTETGYFDERDNYFNSEFAYREVCSLAMDTANNIIDSGSAPEYDNVGWQMREYDHAKKNLVLMDRRSLGGYTALETWLWYRYPAGIVEVWKADDSYDAYAEIENLFEANNSGRVGQLDLYFKAPQNVDDFGYRDYQTYVTVLSYKKTFAAGTAGGAVLSVLLLILCLNASGAAQEGKTGRLYFIDRIPLEILIAVCGGAAACIVAAGVSFWSDIFRNLPLSLTTIAVTVLASMLFVLTLVFSLSRRIKAGTLLQNTLLFRLYHLCRTMLAMIPEMPFTALCGAVLWLLNCWAAFGLRPGFAMASVLVIDLAALIFVLYKTWCSNEAARATSLVVDGNLNYYADPALLRHMTPSERTIITNLGSISEGMRRAVDEQMKSERLKTELITNVSHDIKTPLTSIINYTDLLQKEGDEEKKQEYLEVLSRNAQRLKKLSEDLVDASKASTGNVHTEIVPVNLKEMIDQALAEYEEKLQMAELTPVVTMHDPAARAMADGRLLWRVLSNLLSNCVKYAQPGTRVFISSSEADENRIMLSVKNVSRDILNISAEELMERFVRGDQSRSTEGSGLGLNIARSLTELMGGTFDIRIDGDLFRADILLEKAEDLPDADEETLN